MTTRMLKALVLAAVCMAAPGIDHTARAAGTEKDQAEIRTLIGSTWDKPSAKVVIDPVVIDGEHAVASWTQAERGGRALLRKRETGWAVVLCSGDPLKEATTLVAAGVPVTNAERLASSLAVAEAEVDPQRAKLFATFEGVMRIGEEDAGGHDHHHDGHHPKNHH